MSRRLALPALALVASLLAGCDMLGIESPEKVAAARDAEGRAIGAGCRQAARAIEDCYALNKKGDKAAIFAGWRDMNDYMRENKLEAVTPQVTSQVAKAGGKAEDAGADDRRADKADDTKPAARKTPRDS
jgi:hypothetical protein